MRMILVSLGLLLLVAGCGNTAAKVKPAPSPAGARSSTIARFVKLTALAYERDVAVCEDPAAVGLAGQTRSAAADMKTALKIAPPNGGSPQWRLAKRFGECVAASTNYLRRIVAEAKGTRSVRAGRRDLLASATWAQRAQTAYGAYLAHVGHARVPTAGPSLPPSPSSLAVTGSSVVTPDWAGYGATGGGFRSVTATWTEPDVSLPQDGRTMEVSTWVGLDGQGDVPLEQVGTEAFCAEGVPFVFHKAFFEMLPEPPVYLVRHPRFTFHFTPTYSSWPNLVERWFAELTGTWLRRGTHRSTRELVASIRTWIIDWNENPRPFVWHKSADEILQTLAAYCERISDSGH